MERYKLHFKKSAEKELDKIPKKNLIKIIEAIKELRDNPLPIYCKKLRNDDKYRIRVGNYRILYNINNDILTIFVVKVKHRKDVYK